MDNGLPIFFVLLRVVLRVYFLPKARYNGDSECNFRGGGGIVSIIARVELQKAVCAVTSKYKNDKYEMERPVNRTEKGKGTNRICCNAKGGRIKS